MAGGAAGGGAGGVPGAPDGVVPGGGFGFLGGCAWPKEASDAPKQIMMTRDVMRGFIGWVCSENDKRKSKAVFAG